MSAEGLAAWRAQGRTYRHRALDVFYRDEGAGPALIAIHGFPSASWDWDPMWPALVARFRVVAPDLVGFGYSDKPRAYPYSILDQADMIEGLCAELGVARAHLLAHDYGDTVAQELLARAADRARTGAAGLELLSACLLNGGLFPEAHRARAVQRVLASPVGALVGPLMTERRFGASMRAIFGPATPPSRDLVRELWSLLRFNDGERVVHLLIGYMAERRAHRDRWVDAIARASIPIRLVDGLADPVSGAHMVDRYRELVPSPDVVALAGIGHYPQIEAPTAVLAAFLALHDRVGGAGQGA
ncbi:MAG TPA: alpha/beta hydrolase [Byssovorax sp.]|jgi:pimeloyl-ACP methyl ester carboxylesterase